MFVCAFVCLSLCVHGFASARLRVSMSMSASVAVSVLAAVCIFVCVVAFAFVNVWCAELDDILLTQAAINCQFEIALKNS